MVKNADSILEALVRIHAGPDKMIRGARPDIPLFLVAAQGSYIA